MSGSVLVVDDDRQMVKTLCGVLRLKGWDTTAAYSGEEAVEAVKTGAFSAVVMDVRMPGLDGVGAFRQIRRLAPRLPVILMTAYAAHELLAQAERDGVLMILPKPLPITQLTQVLADVGAHARVLLVDGDADFLAQLTERLRSDGHTVAQAQSLEDALNCLEADAPGLMAMDLRIEGLAAPDEAVVAIKKLSPETLLILYSAQAALLDETLEHLPPGLVHATLRKPFSPERLIEVLHAACQH
ncbi:MAG TPA: response regulator [Vicinamibacterales bacterium]|nr:response regulator [Vicinamibacterales bacterium]